MHDYACTWSVLVPWRGLAVFRLYEFRTLAADDAYVLVPWRGLAVFRHSVVVCGIARVLYVLVPWRGLAVFRPKSRTFIPARLAS